LPGCYLWIISLLLLTTIGLHQILVRKALGPTRACALAVDSKDLQDVSEPVQILQNR
jgi:hypothetical protein